MLVSLKSTDFLLDTFTSCFCLGKEDFTDTSAIIDATYQSDCSVQGKEQAKTVSGQQDWFVILECDHSVVELVLHSHPCLRVTAFLLVNCLDFPADDQEDQEVGEGDNTVEDQMGEQQPGPAADG